MTKTLGLAIISASVVGVISLLAVAMAASGGLTSGGHEEEKITVCDLKGEISGLVRDYNPPLLPKWHDVINWRLQLDKTNCRDVDANPPFWDSLFSWTREEPKDTAVPYTLVPAPRGALIGSGYVDIYVKVYDSSGEFVTEKKFTATTPDGDSEQEFNEPLLFKKLPTGEKWTIKVFHAWKPVEEGPAYGPITVST